MATAPAGAATTGATHRSRPRAVLPALCLTQITSWGIVYYAFPVLLPHLTAATGWSATAASAAFSAALLVARPLGGYPSLFAVLACLSALAAALAAFTGTSRPR